jgi:hypothetical protein
MVWHLSQLWFIPAGFLIGGYGTLIGAGGGFIIVPLLILLYPWQDREVITSISLAVVFFNAASGSAAYARMRRIDYRAGLLFAAFTVPGAILGALSTELLPRRWFDGVMGVLLALVAIYLLIRPGSRRSAPDGALALEAWHRGSFRYNKTLGSGVSLLVGYLASLLGIGGGIIHVPFLANVLHFPVHVATATSHFVLAIMALVSTLVHIWQGHLRPDNGLWQALCLSVGVVVGAQVGAKLSVRIHGNWIIRGLAVGLGAVGVRIFLGAVM